MSPNDDMQNPDHSIRVWYELLNSDNGESFEIIGANSLEIDFKFI